MRASFNGFEAAILPAATPKPHAGNIDAIPSSVIDESQPPDIDDPMTNDHRESL
jgi:hypothetical protein